MKSRLILIREESGLSQAKFAERINVSRNFISLVENGNRELSDRTIKDICSVFDINEDWLRDGSGEMRLAKSRNQQLAEFMNDVMGDVDSSYRKRLIQALSKLSTEEWEVLEKITDALK